MLEAEGFLVTFFKDFELTCNKNDFVKNEDIEEWTKHTKIGVSMMKFAVELTKYLNVNKIDNVEKGSKKSGGKTYRVWFGIKRLFDTNEGVEEEPR